MTAEYSKTNSDSSYEETFDNFYKNDFVHDTFINKGQLLLNGYPYTIQINVPDGGTWLELGSGSGRVIDFNSSVLAHCKCIAVDISRSGIDFCRKFLPNSVDFIVADVKSLPDEVTKKKYDLITLFGTMQAFSKNERFGKLRDFVALLKDGGKLGFSLHPNSLLEFIRCFLVSKNAENIISETELNDALIRAGFSGKFSIEKHHSFIILMKLTRLIGIRPVMWFGFWEYKDTRLTRCLTKVFKRLFPGLTFGYWWIWIEK